MPPPAATCRQSLSIPWGLAHAADVAAERIKVSIRLTQEAHSGWDRACRISGVTMTALVEAIGLELERTPTALGERGPDILEAARQIDWERGSRR